MENKSKTLIAAKELMLNEFNFLEKEYFYSPFCEENQSEIFIEGCAIEYENKIRRREVRINYIKGALSGDIKYTFTISILRLPYSGWEDYFSLSEYLKTQSKDFDTSLELEFDELKVKHVLRKLSSALKEYASEIIKGDLWYENYYPRDV